MADAGRFGDGDVGKEKRLELVTSGTFDEDRALVGFKVRAHGGEIGSDHDPLIGRGGGHGFGGGGGGEHESTVLRTKGSDQGRAETAVI